MDIEKSDSFLITDCGSTTTKAILILKKEGSYRLIDRGEAPTTVEAPFDDVTVGVITAVTELQEITGRTLLDGNKIICPKRGPDEGVDLFLSTSSAGGGLQMCVAGVIKTMTAESAERAALGAGAIVIDVLAVDDGRKEYERIERIRHLRPDMFLLAGGTDGGTKTHLADLAATLLAADTKPRFGVGYQLPVIYAGNVDAREAVHDIIGAKMAVQDVANIRPRLEEENLGPAREAIHDVFLEHVMQQAPGYSKLMGWVSGEIMPTPMAVGRAVQTFADDEKANVLAVDIGGATTDIFSVFGDARTGEQVFNRTVSANYGMSYSICNVLKEAGIANVAKWVPFEIDEPHLRNMLRNKMIRPTTIPSSLSDLLIEQAISREALRLSLDHHKLLAVGLKGVQQQRSVSDAFAQTDSGGTLVNLMDLDWVIGSGGVLSHAPSRTQAAWMMLDGFQPQGVTHLAVDSIFMMPQIGILSELHPAAASEVFRRDCLIVLGSAVAAVGHAKKDGAPCLTLNLSTSDGRTISETVNYGQMRLIPLALGQTAQGTISPAKHFDIGSGPGRTREVKLRGGVVGLIIDCRGIPRRLPEADGTRRSKLNEWAEALGLPRVE
ncbi:MAG: glutamate mutase L [Verrucomicrobia bacterium]|nr:glutamate mutase L [Verrucomicrobiota bacterium]